MKYNSPRARVIMALAGAALATMLPAVAQEVGMRPGGPAATAAPAIVSPLVAERKVTFHLRAPDAKAVTVSGDFGKDTALSRDAEGVWSATVGPLKPDEYVYYFIVDGVRLTDPSNPQVKIGYIPSTTTSIVNVPGDGPAFYDVQDVPHGEIRTLLYKSRSNQVVRELNVYLPPGYDANSRQRYPVLYLLHGFGHTTDCTTGDLRHGDPGLRDLCECSVNRQNGQQHQSNSAHMYPLRCSREATGEYRLLDCIQ
jgi:hypothetical protein